MDSIKEFFQSIFDSYTERIKSPFIGSFIISFLLFNWRVFAILFYSQWPMHCRIEWIENNYCKERNLWIPVAIALFYILILPYLNLGFEWFLSIYANKRMLKNNFKRKAELVSKKGEAILLREIADAQAGTSEITNLNTKIKNLSEEINILNIQNQSDSERFKKNEKRSKEIEDELALQITKLKENAKTYQLTLETQKAAYYEILIPRKIREIIEQLNDRDNLYFVAFCELYILNITSTGVYFPDSVSLFEELELIIIINREDKDFRLTDRGEFVYNTLKNA